MDKELWTFYREAFCNHLRMIRSDMEANGGAFKCSQMLDDALDCIRGVKDLHRIKAMSETAVAK
jgi:hypothetical protein